MNDELAKLQESELARMATVGLHAFSVEYNNLSDTQKTALTMFIRNSLPKEVNITDEEITKAIETAQKSADEAADSQLFKLANSFTVAMQPASNIEQTQTPA